MNVARTVADETSVAIAAPEDEFTAFAKQALPTLTRIAWYLTADGDKAGELVQQTLVRTYHAWKRARHSPLPYARRVMMNQRISTWRARRREVLAPPHHFPERPNPDQIEILAERDRLMRALSRLGARQRRVVVLRHVEGFSEKEVAEMLGIPVGTVKSAGSRGLQRLREVLREEES
ncbi:MAG: SigE family RNA polymerase sigma factor [Micrococcales bacterium]|nr:SigE family RNA polymerase sigma factor [Micrococcales bacterium]MCL2667052.1 SigE family RNA polymerase sigma factor [Micrococcales bacterium]